MTNKSNMVFKCICIFFIVVIVKLVISVVAESSNVDIVECMDCFLSDNCK